MLEKKLLTINSVSLENNNNYHNNKHDSPIYNKEQKDKGENNNNIEHKDNNKTASLLRSKIMLEITAEEAKKELLDLMKTPQDLDKIQPRDNQVWNCDEVGFDPNGNWYKVVCTYKW